jgi:hypothetical protein
MFYCIRFETSLFVASYDSQFYGGGIRARLHTIMTGTEAEVEDYCRQPAGTLTPGIRPRWDHLFNVKIFVFFLSLILLIDKAGVGFVIYIGVHLLHLTPPEVN